ncbi:MAG: hypothetical protein Q8K45_13920 [Rubrivivax sp.]|nr:hypothetical protein [Rubrivivax sp.]
MSYRVIPIRPAEAMSTPVVPPRLIGRPEELRRVLSGLEKALQCELGANTPAPGWLRELRLEADEAWLAFRPDLCAGDLAPAEVAFAALRRLLPDTDIYVGAAAV